MPLAQHSLLASIRPGKAGVGSSERILILGGTGMVGFETARQIAREIAPKLIVIVALSQSKVRNALKALRKEFPEVTFDGAWGDIFLSIPLHEKTRPELLKTPEYIEQLFLDIYGDIEKSSRNSWLRYLIKKYKPQVIVDAINTATVMSDQDDHLDAFEIKQHFHRSKKRSTPHPLTLSLLDEQMQAKIFGALVGQALPKLIRHVQLLAAAMTQVGTKLYLKVGTTGTGGMGLTIPYTHSEDKPSDKLMAKSAVAFAHTGLLFLLARTPGAPIIKEIKPAALVGYRKIEFRHITHHGRPMELFHTKKVKLGDYLNLQPDVGYARLGNLAMVGVDTGENGFFTRGEFEAITAMHQMEYVTPEEIAQTVTFEILGMNTGRDIIAAIDAAVINPSYRAGVLRAPVLEELRRLEVEHNCPSVALGQLGPPELSKLLYEAYLLKSKYQTLQQVIETDAAEISKTLETYLLHHPLRHTIVSIGLPILLSDGSGLLRGPKMNIPASCGEYQLPITPEALNKWAKKGWIDLRPDNMKIWQERFRKMRESKRNFFKYGSAALGRHTYIYDSIEIGEAVGWIFNNDPKMAGFRIKSS